MRKAISIIVRFEKATGRKLHDGKTTVIKIGKTRTRQMTNKQLGVEFKILTDDERELYLGDIMGHDIDEAERYGPILERI